MAAKNNTTPYGEQGVSNVEWLVNGLILQNQQTSFGSDQLCVLAIAKKYRYLR
jgi:hypothetical protein